jgi:hypothetical protein
MTGLAPVARRLRMDSPPKAHLDGNRTPAKLTCPLPNRAHSGRSCPMTATETLDLSAVQTALVRSRQPELRRLAVVEIDERIEISGRVSSFYMKSIALETAKAAADGRSISLNIEVDR